MLLDDKLVGGRKERDRLLVQIGRLLHRQTPAHFGACSRDTPSASRPIARR
jgi:hypothetical protein